MTLTRDRGAQLAATGAPGRLARRLGAILTLAALVAGVPYALTVIAPVRLPSRVPTVDSVWAAISRPDDGSLLLSVLAVAAWALWGLFTLSALGEALAQARSWTKPQIRSLGLIQHAAASLVTTAGLVLVTAAPAATAMAGSSGPEVAQVEPVLRPEPRVAVAVRATNSSAGATVAAPQSAPAEADRHPVVTVQEGESLWALAERHLGDGGRFVELVDLNLRRPQPDGHALTDAHWIEPGWLLRLPMDAVDVPAPVYPPAPVGAAASTHDVVPGDTLWAIAAEHLGDGARYPEVYALNAGVEQADGRTLSDPDLIYPGWQLAVAMSPGSPAPPGEAEGPADPSVPLPPIEPDATPHSRDVAPRAFAGTETAGAVVPEILDDVGTEETAEVDLDLDPQPSTALVLGLTALAAGALATELALRRRRQHRLRRAGESIPLPATASPQEDAERLLRRAIPALTFADLRRGLVGMFAACLNSGRPLPRLGAVVIAADHLDLRLTEDDPHVVEPFILVDTRTWRANRVDFLAQSVPEALELPDPYPALITLGMAGPDTVLIDLEAAGTLSITGPDIVATAVLRALACEVVTSPLALQASPLLSDELADLVAATDPLIVPRLAAGQLGLIATQTARGITAALQTVGAPDTLSARARGVGDQCWAPTVLLGASPPGAVAPWSGLVAVTTSDQGSWRLSVDDDHHGHLAPLGIDLDVQHLGADAYTQVLAAMAGGLTELEREDPVPPTVEDQIGAVAAALGPQPEPLAPSEPVDVAEDVPAPRVPTEQIAEPPKVLLLGKVVILSAGATVSQDRERRLTELIAYLALHPDATTDQLDEVIGRGQPVKAAIRNGHISRARAWLGTTPDGEPYLPKLSGRDSYRLHPSVRTDWDDFRDLLRAGVQAGRSGGPALRAALDLVRGRPFDTAAPGAYDWAEAHLHPMIGQIVDAAHLYAVVATDPADYRSVREALAIGLVVDPCNEMLYRDAIAAAHRAGDVEDVARLAERLQRRIEEIDPSGGLEEETIELLSSLKVA